MHMCGVCRSALLSLFLLTRAVVPFLNIKWMNSLCTGFAAGKALIASYGFLHGQVNELGIRR